MKEWIIPSIQELETYAREILGEIAPLPRPSSSRHERDFDEAGEGAVVLALTGELGAGKTAFVKAIAKQLGIDEHVTSPTFVIMKKYGVNSATRNLNPVTHNPKPESDGLQATGYRFRELVHIDAYRLESVHELEVLGWNELLADPDTLIAIEWPERVPGAIPASAHYFVFEHVDETTRKISSK